jgi:acyl-CoA synthetase (AMP-forming)/AMP-acid ligase II/alkylation response protein AidB-like acyl-CoA dehydrogenase/acyl carrier protein
MKGSSICDVIRERAQEQPAGQAFCYLTNFFGDEGLPGPLLRYDSLDLQARAIAAVLADSVPAGERALLLYPPGLDFLPAFFGCLYAGIIAVPVPPMDARRLRRTLARLQAVIADARPVLALTTFQVLATVSAAVRQAPELGALQWIATDQIEPIEAEGWRQREVREDAVAYLQYTSGSTSTPKGVVVTHRGLLANSESIRRAWGYGPDSTSLMWVPNFHDDGLVHGIVQPLYAGFPAYLMSPLSVVEQPVRWLQAIGRYRATHSGGPNFAYTLCVDRVPAEERSGLDLASWRVAYNAAEPIHPETLESFSRAYEPSGFRREAFFPSFGLAEATLLVSTKAEGTLPSLLPVRSGPLETEGRVVPAPDTAAGARTLVGCGPAVPGTEVAVADPVSGRRRGADEVGEIWIAGPGVAGGYWNRPEATAETFGARLDDGAGPFLRTGDLGFLHDGELYITGRLKDVIIVRGRNCYPQDIELTVERASPELRPGCGAAFSLELDGEERLIVVQEARHPRDVDAAAVAAAVCREVAEAHELQVYALVLIPPRTLPKTSSGKIQRHACRTELLAGQLEEVGGWVLGQAPGGETVSGLLRRRVAASRPAALVEAVAAAAPAAPAGRAGELLTWLRSWAEERLDSRLIDERRSIPPSVVLDLGDRGLFGLQVESGSGGLALSHRETARVLAQLGAIDLTLGCLVSGHNSLGLRPLQRYATEPVHQALLPDLVRGRALGAFALTEPGAGSNPRAIVTQAIPEGGGWRLRGSKVWTGSAAWAGVTHVFAQVPGTSARSGGITGFAVRRGTPGLRLGPEALTMGLRGMVQSAVFLDGVKVGEEDLLGGVGDGLEVAEDAIALSRLFLAAVSVGGMKRCAQLMARYAGRRTVATGRLLDHPVTRARLGEVIAATAAVEALTDLAAARLDEGRPVPREVLAALKTAAAEALWQAADHLVQCLGGRGYVETNFAPQILRDARIFRVFEGPSEALHQFVGASLLQGSSEIGGFLRQLPGGTAIADRLREVVEESRERTPGRLDPGDRVSSLRWTYHRAGELAASALLLAALEAQAGAGRRALEWARARFEADARRALAGTPEEVAMLSAEEAAGLMEELAGAIGDVRQGLAGEDHAVDPLLLRTPAPVAGEGGGAGPAVPEPEPEEMPVLLREVPPFSATVQEWMARWLVDRIGIAEAAIDPAMPFTSLGLDSVTGVQMAADLGAWLGRPVDSTLAWDYPTIAALAAHLGGGGAAAESPGLETEDDELLAILRDIETLSPEQAEQVLEQELIRIKEGSPDV